MIRSDQNRALFRRKLLAWFARNGRDLPWRKTRDPYKIWVSEVMLQQTQVDRVVGFYRRFLKRFPTVRRLAAADWTELLEYWRGLGYYGRGRNMLRAAQAIVAQHGGRFPHRVEELEALPGIGPYTARAIAVFAHEQDVLVLDTNTRRVLSRVFNREAQDPPENIVPRGKAWAFHQGLMDFGALVCTARHPKCGECAMRSFCRHEPEARAQAPKRTRSLQQPTMEVAVGIIHRNGKILIARRRKGRHLEGVWEFPGGKREGREDWRACLKREIAEELGIEVAVRPHDWTADYLYSDRSVHLRFHRCSILAGEPEGREGQELRWVLPGELRAYEFPPANREVVAALARARFPSHL